MSNLVLCSCYGPRWKPRFWDCQLADLQEGLYQWDGELLRNSRSQAGYMLWLELVRLRWSWGLVCEWHRETVQWTRVLGVPKGELLWRPCSYSLAVWAQNCDQFRPVLKRCLVHLQIRVLSERLSQRSHESWIHQSYEDRSRFRCRYKFQECRGLESLRTWGQTNHYLIPRLPLHHAIQHRISRWADNLVHLWAHIRYRWVSP